MEHGATPAEVATFLSALHGVEMIRGDVTDPTSLATLLEGCTAVLALHGPQRMTHLIDFIFDASSKPTHAKQVNYVGVANLIKAVTKSPTCNRIVRVTGKGEDPWRVVAILINLVGGMAKAWNYEGESLLRQSSIDYTIIRPGRLVSSCPGGAVLALCDNGGDLKVSSMKYTTVASLCVDVLNHDNTRRSTLCAMNVPYPKGATVYTPLLQGVRPDTRIFPVSMLRNHRLAVAVGGTIFTVVSGAVVVGIVGAVRGVIGMFMR